MNVSVASIIIMVIASNICSVAEASEYRLIGAGADSCGRWIEDRRTRPSGDSIADEQWVLGFLSGVGDEAAPDRNPLSGEDAFGVLAWFDNYCIANPLIGIAAAAAEFVKVHPK